MPSVGSTVQIVGTQPVRRGLVLASGINGGGNAALDINGTGIDGISGGGKAVQGISGSGLDGINGGG